MSDASLYRFNRRVLLLAAAATAAALVSADGRAAQVNITYTGAPVGVWNLPANWSPSAVPNNGADTYNVFVDGGNAQNSVVTVPISSTFTIDNLTISAGDQVDVLNNTFLVLVGDGTLSTLNNAGTVRILGTANSTDLRLNATDNTISGGGTIQLAATSRFLSASGGRVTNVNNMIEGNGTLGVNTGAITNQSGGTIRASDAGLTLALDPGPVANPFVNQGLLSAVNGSILLLTGSGGGAFDNTGGTIRAEAASEVRFTSGATITGGLLTTNGSGVLRNNASQNLNLRDLTNAGHFIADNNTDTNIAGTITNSGSININAGANATDIELGGGTVTLTGAGTVNLNGVNARINGAGTLLNVNNMIRGQGDVGVNTIGIINQSGGTIRADVAGALLTLDPGNLSPTEPELVNAGRLEAGNGGILQLTGSGGGDFGNSGTIEAQDGSEVQFTGGTSISGGTLSTAGSGVLRVNASATASLTTLTNTGQLVANNNSNTILSGTITNSGTITLNAGANATDLVPASGETVTLAGGGVVILGSTGAGSNARIQGSGSVVNSDNTIRGQGNIGANNVNLINQALIQADVDGRTLVIDPAPAGGVVNTGTLQASNGGILLLTGSGGGAFDNTGGTIRAEPGSEVQFTAVATITGGLLTTSGSGVLRNNASQNLNLRDLTNAGHFIADNNTDTNIAGTITNSGSININAGANATDIELGGGTATLTGAGTVNLNGVNARINGAGTLLNVNNVIRGQGNLGTNTVAVINQGTILAAGGTLTIDPIAGSDTFTSNGTLSAASGGTLSLTGSGGGNFNSSAGAVSIESGGTLTTLSSSNLLAGPVIMNGTWNHTAGSTATVTNIRGSGALNVSSATLSVAANGGTLGTSRLGVLPTFASGGRFDLTDNDLVIDYTGASPIDSLRGLIQTAYASGAWNGAGLTSSSAAGSDPRTALGYREASEMLGAAGGIFSGQSVDGTALLIKYTYAGDATLDGKVDVGDLGALASNWQLNAFWGGGDFDYNGTVNVGDLGLLATNWQKGVTTPPLGPSFAEALAALGLPNVGVPEPGSMVIALALPAIASLRRGRKGRE